MPGTVAKAPLKVSEFYTPRSQSAAWQAYSQGFAATLLTAAPFDPSTIAGLKLWLKADSMSLADGTAVGTWADQSGNGNDATQATAGLKPLFKTNRINSLPALKFDGVDDCMVANMLGAVTTSDTVFIVQRKNANSATLALLSFTPPSTPSPANNSFAVYLPYSDGNVYFDLGDTTATGRISAAWGGNFTDFFVWSFAAGGGNMAVYRNGTTVVSSGGHTNSFTPAGLTLGINGFSTAVQDADIAEILIYNVGLSTTDRQNVENYLGQKYGITVSGGGGAPAASLTVKTLKALAATFAPIAALSRAVAKGLAATKTLTAALTRNIPRSFTATLFQAIGGGGGGTPDLINENFEGTGVPSGWSQIGSANFDYSAVPLAGLQSLRCDSATSDTGQYDTGGVLNNSEIWFNFLYKIETDAGTFERNITLKDSGGTVIYGVFVFPAHTLRVDDAVSTTSLTTDSLSVGTIYSIWGHYKKGTGSDSVMEVSFDVVGNPRPNSGTKWAGFTNGLSTTNVTSVQLVNSAGGVAVFDNLQVASTDIFSGSGGGGGGGGWATLTRIQGKWFAATLSFVGAFAKSFISGGGTTFTQAFNATLFNPLILYDSYPESNQSTQVTISGTPSPFITGQSFMGNGQYVVQVSFWLKKLGAPSGGMTAAIYSHSGTFGTSSVGVTSLAGSVSQTANTVLTTSFQLITFTFSTPFLTTNGTPYVVAMNYSNGDASNNVIVGADNTSPTHAGNSSTFNGGSWTAVSGTDLCFYVYTQLGFSAILTKNTTRFLTATKSFVGAINRSISRSLTAALSFVGAITKRTTRFLSATLSFVGAFAKSKAIQQAFTATLSFVGAMTTAAVHHFTQSLTATLSFIGTFSERNAITRFFTATLSSTASLTKSTAKALSATLSTSASLIRRITRTLNATLSGIGSLVKAIRDAGFSATLSFVGNLVGTAAHFFTRSFTATLSFVGSLTSTRFVQRIFTATLAFSATLRGRTAKLFAATLSFSTAARKAIRKVLRGTLGFIGFLFRGGAVTIIAGVITGAFVKMGLAGSSARIVKTGSRLRIERTK